MVQGFTMGKISELFGGISQTIETITLSGTDSNLAIIMQMPKACTIDSIGVNAISKGGAGHNLQFRIFSTTDGTRGTLKCTATVDRDTLTYSASGRFNMVGLGATSYTCTAGETLYVECRIPSSSGGNVVLAYRMADTFNSFGNRYRFPFGKSNGDATYRDGVWMAVQDTNNNVYGWAANSLTQTPSSIGTGQTAFGNSFVIPQFGSTMTLSGVEVLSEEGSDDIPGTLVFLEAWQLSGTSATKVSSVTSAHAKMIIHPSNFNKIYYFTTPITLNYGTTYAVTSRCTGVQSVRRLNFQTAAQKNSWAHMVEATGVQISGFAGSGTTTATVLDEQKLYLVNPIFSSVSGAGLSSSSFTPGFNSLDR
jgi:hypothetical protein